MLTQETKRKIDSARDILVGKVPDPKAQVEQITTAMIYKFMDDMDKDAVELGGKARFFTNGFEKYAWSKLLDSRLGGHERLDLYAEAIVQMSSNPHIPQLFRDIFKDAFLPYRSPETLSLFLKEINGFTYNHSENLGDAFEYLLSIMSSQGDAGQFRTPRHIIDFITEVVDPKKDESILDPACGTAGFLISAYKHILKQHDGKNDPEHKEKPLTPDDKKKLMNNLVGYDISPDMVKLSKVNMYLHGFAEPKIYEYDTLSSDEKWDEMYDVIMANPPFMSPKGGIRPHKRFSVQANRSEVLFVDYILEHLRPNGRAGIIVPEGIIFQSGNAYKQLRKMLVEDGLFAVVSLPNGIFNPYSGVKTSILFFDNVLAKRTNEILFVKIDSDGFDLGAQRRKIESNDLTAALIILKKYIEDPNTTLLIEVKNLATLVSKTRISEKGDYNLSSDEYKQTEVISNKRWPMKELGSLFEMINGRAFKKEEWKTNGTPIIRIANLNDNNAEFNYLEGNCDDKIIVKNGDLLFSWSGTRGTSFGPHIWNRGKGVLNQHIYKFQPLQGDIDIAFAYLVIKIIVPEIEAQAHGAGGLVHITKEKLKHFRIPVPPLPVQKQIVEQIEGYQKIIEGAKQVVKNWKPITDINPDWETALIQDLCTLVRGSSPRPKGDKRYYDGKIPRLMVSDVTRDGMYTTPQTDSLTEEGSKLSRPMKKGEVVMAVSGNPGLPTILTVDACINDGFVGFRKLSSKIIPEFLYFILLRQKDENNSRSVGAVFKNLTTDQIKKFKIPVPPINIQLELVEQITQERQVVGANEEIIREYEAKIQNEIKDVNDGKAHSPLSKNQNELIKQLKDDFESIESEVIRMMGNKEIFKEIKEISKRNSQINKGNSLWDFLKESYVALMVSAVCRQIDTDERSSSLVNLLRTILFNPTVIQSLNKDWYSEQYHRDNDIFPGFMEGIGKGDFEEHFGSKEYVDPAIVYMDLKKLEEDTKEIKKYRNKRIAHFDKKESLFKANYDDLHKAVETVRSIASKYYLLLKQGGNDLIPSDQTDWQEILTIPWIKK